MVQPSTKFASLKEQSLIYGDIPDDDPIDYHDVKVGQGSPEEMAAAIEGLDTSVEQAGMSRDSVYSLRILVTEYEGVLRLKLRAEPPANVKPLVITLRGYVKPVRMSARKYAMPHLTFMLHKMRELEELNLVYKNSEAEWASPRSSFRSQGPTSIS
jgi:hypothetical protein